ncbi:MAG: hypothetical protein NTZ97_02645 [Candidatus Moranbacteria bacterium]|nr:hypothetical protein [Candidatus Moranbacteria bacterium]
MNIYEIQSDGLLTEATDKTKDRIIIRFGENCKKVLQEISEKPRKVTAKSGYAYIAVINNVTDIIAFYYVETLSESVRRATSGCGTFMGSFRGSIVKSEKVSESIDLLILKKWDEISAQAREERNQCNNA